jgi:hypothetical protein
MIRHRACLDKQVYWSVTTCYFLLLWSGTVSVKQAVVLTSLHCFILCPFRVSYDMQVFWCVRNLVSYFLPKCYVVSVVTMLCSRAQRASFLAFFEIFVLCVSGETDMFKCEGPCITFQIYFSVLFCPGLLRWNEKHSYWLATDFVGCSLPYFCTVSIQTKKFVHWFIQNTFHDVSSCTFVFPALAIRLKL